MRKVALLCMLFLPLAALAQKQSNGSVAEVQGIHQQVMI